VLPRVEVRGGVVKLSATENALVAEIARGLTNREAAVVLGRTEAAVRSQLSRIYRKLGLRRRAQLIMMFRG
jgi:DNA-binding CsgD family transcriptional regulator